MELVVPGGKEPGRIPEAAGKPGPSPTAAEQGKQDRL